MNYDNLKPFATERQWQYIEMKRAGLSNSKVAEALGIDRRAVDRGIQSVHDKATAGGAVLDTPTELKVLYIDIETAPTRAWVWSMYSEVRSIDMLASEWFIMSYAYKWQGNDEVFTKTLNMCDDYEAGSEDDRELVSDLHALLSHADVVVAHNGDNFDLKKIRARMICNGMTPPEPFRTIDTLKICRREFGFISNKLDYVGQLLLNKAKVATGGIDLWFECMKGDEDAWKRMWTYNAMDVELLEEVYLVIRAWDRSHPNLALLSSSSEISCTVCASEDVSRTGKYVHTPSSTFEGYVCNDCGHHMRGKRNVRSKLQKENVTHNAR
jgi:transposase-like protein